MLISIRAYLQRKYIAWFPDVRTLDKIAKNFRQFRTSTYCKQEIELGKSASMAFRIVELGRRALSKHPVLTNTAVYATFYAAAELSQQTFNKFNSPDKPDLDLASAGRVVTVGSCVYAPTLYYWYKFLDSKFPGKALKSVVTKVASDQCIMTPMLLAAFYTLIAVLERKENIFEELQAKYWKTFVANQAFWIPGQTINFFFLPPHLRVVYVASASFIWINVLCFIKRQKTEKHNA